MRAHISDDVRSRGVPTLERARVMCTTYTHLDQAGTLYSRVQLYSSACRGLDMQASPHSYSLSDTLMVVRGGIKSLYKDDKKEQLTR